MRTTLLVLILCVAAHAEETLQAKDAKIEKVAGGFRFTEGPAADEDGNVYFSDIPNQCIHRLDVASGKVTVWSDDSGRSNGLMFDAKGRLHACEGGRRRLVRYEGKKAHVLAERWNEKRLNSPNDLAIDDKGGVYFTDPRYGKQDGREIDIEAVYYAAADGKVTQVITEVTKPNGILLSKDKKTLYVAASGAKRIRSYPVEAPGKLGKGVEFAALDTAPGGPDGMTLDEQGNVYAAGQGAIWIWDKTGKRLARIEFPESPANCAFGGKDRKTLYVTARTSLYRLEMNVRGAR